MKYIILSLLSISLLACSTKWDAANERFGNKYGLKMDQEYEVVKDFYVDYGHILYPLKNIDYCGLGETEKLDQDSVYITLKKGTRFKTVGLDERTGYMPVYFYFPRGVVLSPSPHAGREFTFDKLMDVYNTKNYTYIRKVEK